MSNLLCAINVLLLLIDFAALLYLHLVFKGPDYFKIVVEWYAKSYPGLILKTQVSSHGYEGDLSSLYLAFSNIPYIL